MKSILSRGMIEAEQVFPYPEVLDADQKETLQMLVGVKRVSVVTGNFTII